MVRGSALQERSKPYIAALEVQGMSPWAICLRHLLPNCRVIVVAQATTLFGYAMVDLAAISFIGLGVQQPAADWGVMVFENRQGIAIGKPLPALVGGLCLIVVVIAFNILGERLAQRREVRPMTALLEIDDLVVQLPVGGALRPVLRGIDLRLDAGEALGLVGESGSGKSMTARAIDRLLPAGRDVHRIDPSRRRRRRVAAQRRPPAVPPQRVDGVPGPTLAHQPGAPHRRLHDRGGRGARHDEPP